MGLLDLASLTLSDANAIAGLASTGDQLKALSARDADFADWLQTGLGKFSQANTLLKSGQGIMAAYDAMQAGKSFADVANAATSGQGVGALGSVGAAVAKALPWIGLGLSIYDMTKNGVNANNIVPAGESVATLLFGSAGGMAAAIPFELSGHGVVGASLDKMFGGDRKPPEFVRSNSEDYVSQTDDDNYYYIYKKNANGSINSPAFRYNKKDNVFERQVTKTVHDPDGDLSNGGDAEKEVFDHWAPVQLAQKDGVVYLKEGPHARSDYLSIDGLSKALLASPSRKVPEGEAFSTYANTVVPKSAATPGVGYVFTDDWTVAAPLTIDGVQNQDTEGDDMAKTVTDKDKYMKDYGVTSDAFDKQVADGIINYTPATVDTAPPSGTTPPGGAGEGSNIIGPLLNSSLDPESDDTINVIVSYGDKYLEELPPEELASLKAKVEAAGGTVGGNAYNSLQVTIPQSAVASLAGIDGVTAVASPITPNTYDNQGDPTTDSTAPTVSDVVTTPATETPPPAEDHPVYRTQAELEELFGMEPGALAEMAEQVRQATADVDTAYNSKISRPGGLNVIPLGQQKAAEARLRALQDTYNPYDLASRTAAQEEIQGNKNWYDQQIINQRHQLGLADRNQVNALKKDYALWAKDNDIIRDYDTDLTTGQKLATYANAIKAAGASVGDIIKVGNQAIQVTQALWDKIKDADLFSGDANAGLPPDSTIGYGDNDAIGATYPITGVDDYSPVDFDPIFPDNYGDFGENDSLFGGSTF